MRGRYLRAASGALAAWVMLSPAVSGIVQSGFQLGDFVGYLDPASRTMAVELPPVAEEPPPAPRLTLDLLRASVNFPDLPVGAAADAVRYVSYQGILNGYSNGTFRPEQLLTRGQALTILQRMADFAGLNDASTSKEQTPVEWALAAKLLVKDSKGEYYLDNLVTRAQMSVLLYRFARYAGLDIDNTGDLSAWPDGAAVPDFARGSTAWALEQGIFSTIVEGYLSPQLGISRGQAAQLATALLSKLPDIETPSADSGPDTETLAEEERAWLPPDANGTAVAVTVRNGTAVAATETLAEEERAWLPPETNGTDIAVAETDGTAVAVTDVDGTAYAIMEREDTVAAEIAAEAARDSFSSLSRAKHEQLQADIEAAAKRYGAVGVQVAVIEGGRLSDVYAAGWAVKGKVPMTADHKIRIASISKVIVGLTAMRMRQDGLVGLDVPIGTYWNASIANSYHPSTPVTIRTLLSHTSSISTAEVSLKGSSVLSRLGRGSGFTRAVPGDIGYWNYNNYAFGVLGLTLEKAGNQTVDGMLRRYFFTSMDIDGGFYAGDLENPSLVAPIYRYGGSVGRTVEAQTRSHAGAPGSDGDMFAGGLTISVRDLGKLAALLANDGMYEGVRLLSEESVQLMETASGSMVSDGFYQGLPLRIRPDAYGRTKICYHTGSAYGVYSGFSYDPATGDGVVVVTTGASGARDGNGNYAVCGSIFDSVYHAIAR